MFPLARTSSQSANMIHAEGLAGSSAGFLLAPVMLLLSHLLVSHRESAEKSKLNSQRMQWTHCRMTEPNTQRLLLLLLLLLLLKRMYQYRGTIRVKFPELTLRVFPRIRLLLLLNNSFFQIVCGILKTHCQGRLVLMTKESGKAHLIWQTCGWLDRVRDYCALF